MAEESTVQDGQEQDPGPSPVDEPAEFFRRYSPYVARIAIRLHAVDDELEDLVHDVFMSAFRQADKLRDPAAVRGWLATITVRTVRRHLRRHRMRRWVGLDAAPSFQLESMSASPEQRMQVTQIYRLLDALAVEDAMAWKLRHVEGERLKDTAARLGCSLATVKRRIARASAHLEVNFRG